MTKSKRDEDEGEFARITPGGGATRRRSAGLGDAADASGDDEMVLGGWGR